MLAAFDRREFDAVLVVAVDRLLRRLVDVVDLREPRRPREVRIITARDGIDTGQGLGRVLVAILVALAEGEILNKDARGAAAREERLARGVPTPGRAPFGYRWVPESTRRARGDDRRYDVDEAEAAIVRSIFAEALAGVPLGAICRGLAERGLMTRDGAPWRSPTVRRMLLSPLYAGLLPEVVALRDRPLTASGRPRTYRAEDVDLDACTPGAWEPIVSADEVRAARHLLLDRGRRTNGGDTTRRHLLSGLARCGARLGEFEVCGTPVRSASTREGHRGYRCPRGHFLRRGDAIEHYVVEAALARLSEPDAAGLIRPSSGVDIAALRAREVALDARRAEVLALVAAGRFGAAEALPHLSPIEADLVSVRAALAEVHRVDPLAAIVDADDVRAYWEGLTLARRRIVLAALFEPILLPVGKGWRVVAESARGRQVLVSETVELAWRRNVEREGGAWAHPLTEEARRALAAS
jgi:hypothetical protein